MHTNGCTLSLDTHTHTHKGLLPLYSPPPLNLYSNAQAPLFPNLHILFLIKKPNEAILSIRLDSVFNVEFMTWLERLKQIID